MQTRAHTIVLNNISKLTKKITDKNKVFPVYLTSSSEYVFLSTFRYRVPKDVSLEPDNNHTLGYYETQALYKGDLVNYTISKDFLGTLDDVNLDNLKQIRINGLISDLVIKTNKD